MKEDYPVSYIFSTAIYIILGAVLLSVISYELSVKYWFWLGFLGLLAGLTLGVWRYKLRVFETLEAAVMAFLPWLSFIFLADSVKNASWVSFSAFAFLLFLIFVCYFLDATYKNFTWYKSGKVGFSGLAVLAILFLTRALVSLFYPFVLSLAGKTEVYFSSLAAFILFLLIFNLSRSK